MFFLCKGIPIATNFSDHVAIVLCPVRFIVLVYEVCGRTSGRALYLVEFDRAEVG